MHWLCWLACSLLLWLGQARADIAPLPLQQTADRLPLGEWLETQPAGATAALPSQLPPDRWQPLRTPHLQAGWSAEGRWFRLRVRNDGPPAKRILQFSRAGLADLQLYHQQADGQLGFVQAGYGSRHILGDIVVPGYGFQLSLPTGDSEFLLYVANHGPLTSPIYLSTPNAVLRHAQDTAGWFGAGLGAITTAWLLLAMRNRRRRRPYAPLLALTVSSVTYALSDRGVFGSWWLTIAHAQPLFLATTNLFLAATYLWLVYEHADRHTVIQRRQRSCLHGISGLLLVSSLLSFVLSDRWLAGFSIFSPTLTLGLCCLALCTLPGSQPRVLQRWLLLATALHGLMTCNQLGWLLPWTQAYQWFLAGSLLLSPLLARVVASAPGRIPPPAPAVAAAPAQASALSGVQASPAQAARQAPPASLSGRQILVVEDNHWVQQVLVGQLTKLGCRVDAAAHGEAALTLLHQQRYDLVLMDCDMPVLDGLTATQLWRQHEQAHQLPPVPILAVTAHVSAEQRQLALEAGMNDFIAKPVDLRLLRLALLNWMPAAGSGQPDRPA